MKWVRGGRAWYAVIALILAGIAIMVAYYRVPMKAELTKAGASDGRTYRIGVVSDTHIPVRAGSIPPGVFHAFSGVDYIIHAGDIVSFQATAELEEVAPVVAVYGNMDPPEVRAKYPSVNSLEVGGVRIGVVHDSLSPWMMERMREFARANNYDVLVFGHTHRPYLKEDEGRLYLNPGSPTQPLIARPSVAVLTIAGGKVSAEIVYL